MLPALERVGVRVGTHILQCGGVHDDPFSDGIEYAITQLTDRRMPVLNEAAGREMTARILEAKAEGDSVGGVTQTAVTGLCFHCNGEQTMIR